MAKIVRYDGNLKAFASEQLTNERTLFGQVTIANDLTSQITAQFLRGWGNVGPSDQPSLQDFNAAMYTHGQLLAYLHQMGVPEYNLAQEYYLNSFTNYSGVIYVSLANSNVGNTPDSSPLSWKRFGSDQATETFAGVAEVATQAEVTAGTSDSVMITPKKLAGASTADTTDSTAGKLLRVADFGVGAPSASPDAPNLNNATAGGFYSYTAAATNAPLAAVGALIVIAQAGATTQLAIDRASQRSFVRTVTSSSPVTWSAWREVGVSSLATTSAPGIVQLATSAQMQAGSSTTLVPPVSAVISLLPKRVFAGNDFIRIPDVAGGLIIQWGVVAVPAYSDGTSFSGTWSTPFPVACHGMLLTAIGAVNILRQGSVTLSGFSAGTATRDQAGSSSLSSAFFVSIGY